MGYYYKIYTPDLTIADEGKFSGMPFFESNLPIELHAISNLTQTYGGAYPDIYGQIIMITKDEAIKLQEIMKTNKTIFTDIMERESCDGLLIQIT